MLLWFLFFLTLLIIFLFSYSILINVHVILYYFTCLCIILYWKLFILNTNLIKFNFAFICIFLLYFWSVSVFLFIDIFYLINVVFLNKTFCYFLFIEWFNYYNFL